MKPLSINAQAENEELRKAEIFKDLFTVFRTRGRIMKPLSIDEINRLQSENEQLRKIIVETPISTVIAVALWGTIIGQIIVGFIQRFMDVLLK